MTEETVKVIFIADSSGAVTGVRNIEAEVVNLNTALIKLSSETTGVFAGGLRTSTKYAEELSVSLDQVAKAAATAGTAEEWLTNKQQLMSAAFRVNVKEMDAARKAQDAVALNSEHLNGRLKSLASQGFSGLTSAIRGTTGGLLHLLNPMNDMYALIGGGMGLGFLIGQTEKWTQDVASVTLAMNGNAEAGSTLLAVFDRLGISGRQVISRLDQLAHRMDTMPESFTRLGLTVYDAHGKLKDMNTFVPEVMAKLRQLGNTTQGLAAANEIFGRSAGNFAQAMLIASNNWDVLSEAARRYGLVIGNDALGSQVALQQGMKSLEQQFKGIELTLGTALMPAIIQLGQTMANFVVQNLPAIKAAIAQFVGFIIEAAHVLFGFTTEVDKSAQALSGYITAAGAASAATNNDVAAKTKGNSATKAMTEATNDLVQAKDAEVKSLERQRAALDQADEARIRDNDLIIKNLDYTRQQQAEQDKLTADQSREADDTATLSQALFNGNVRGAQAAEKKITADKAAEAKAQQTLSDNTAKHQIGIENAQIRDSKAARDADFNARIQALQDEVSRIRQAAQDNLQALTASSNQATSVFAGNMGQLPAIANQNFSLIDGAASLKGKAAADNFFQPFKDAQGNVNWGLMGSAIGANIGQGMISGIQDTLRGQLAGIVQNALTAPMHAIQALGAAANHIADGRNGVGSGPLSPNEDPFHADDNGELDFLGSLQQSGTSRSDAIILFGQKFHRAPSAWDLSTEGFSYGGIASGPATGFSALLHGTEAILPLNNPSRSMDIIKQTGLLGGTTGGSNRTNHFYINVTAGSSEEHIAQVIVEHIAREFGSA